MFNVAHKIKVVEGADHKTIPERVLSSDEPILLKGFVDAWPAVSACQQSDEATVEFVKRYGAQEQVASFYGEPEIKGRYFYNDTMDGYNYERVFEPMSQALDNLLAENSTGKGRGVYVGSTSIDSCLPGFQEKNHVNFGEKSPLASIWIGNQSRISAHYDFPDNIACCVAGKRRFTLFPPDQLANLYVGPLEFTPAGQPISLVDFHQPDFDRFPKFKEAMANATVAELEPGDAIFIPSMWWHHVEGLDSLNILVNYWWRNTPKYMGPPSSVLSHALLAIRDLPADEKLAWKNILEHYVFNDSDETNAHIPEHALGSLAPMDDTLARKIRALVLNKLNR